MSLLSIISSVIGSSGGSTPPPSGNTIVAIWTEDIARNWIRVEFENSIVGDVPDVSQFDVMGDQPTEVVIRFDKVLYLRFASDFSNGEGLNLDYTAAGGLLGDLGDQLNVPITNYITTATKMTWATSDYFLGVDDDFPHNGKIIVVPAGSYGSLDIGRGENITFVCGEDGDAEFTYCNFREAVIHPTLIGHPARVMSLKIHETYNVHFGIGCFATGNIRFEDLEIYDHQQGVQVKTVSDLDFPPYNLSRLDYQNLTMRRFKIGNVSEEALYIGADVAAPLIPITWLIEDSELWDIGKDCYQVRNGGGIVRRGIGRAVLKDWVCGNEDADDGINGHFCTFGTTSNGCVFEDMVTDGNARACGFFINGYGDILIKNCNVTSYGRTVTLNNYNNLNGLGATHQTLTFEGVNVLDCIAPSPYSLDARRDAAPGKLPTTLNINDTTTFVDATYIEDMPEEEFPPSSGFYRGGITVNYT